MPPAATTSSGPILVEEESWFVRVAGRRSLAAALALIAPAVALSATAASPGTRRRRAPRASASAAALTARRPSGGRGRQAVFFASDGLRQDLVERYARRGVMPTMRELLRRGTRATGNGLLTQAPPNTGAGWYSLATGAWPGVHGSTNNTFHKNGDAFANRTSAFDPGVLQAESIAQAAERDGLRVAQVEWAGGRNASIQGPTIDFRTFHSGRGVATNFIGRPGEGCSTTPTSSPRSGCSSTTRDGYAGQRRSRAPSRRRPPAGATCRPRTARPWRCGCGCWTSASTSTA